MAMAMSSCAVVPINLLKLSSSARRSVKPLQLKKLTALKLGAMAAVQSGRDVPPEVPSFPNERPGIEAPPEFVPPGPEIDPPPGTGPPDSPVPPMPSPPKPEIPEVPRTPPRMPPEVVPPGGPSPDIPPATPPEIKPPMAVWM